MGAKFWLIVAQKGANAYQNKVRNGPAFFCESFKGQADKNQNCGAKTGGSKGCSAKLNQETTS